MQACHTWRSDGAVFDEENFVSHAGLVPVLELAELGQRGQGVSIGRVEFAQQRRDMALDRPDRDVQPAGDLRVRQVPAHGGQHLGLPGRDLRRVHAYQDGVRCPDACRPPGWLYILKQGGHDAQPDRVPRCGVTVMDELSIHWKPLLLNSDTPPRTGRPTGPTGPIAAATLPTVFEAIPPNPPRRP